MTRAQDWAGESWAPDYGHDEFGSEQRPRAAERAKHRDAGGPVNPYAVVALIAAGLGLFPVAILFGLLAFARRGGRGIAMLAVLLGLAEVAAVGLAIGAVVHHNASGFTVSVSRSGIVAHVLPDTTAPASSPAPPPPGPAPSQSVAPTAAQGVPCTRAQALLVSVTDSVVIVCHPADQLGNYRWSAPQPLAPGIHDKGEHCDPTLLVGTAGRTSDSHAVVCAGTGHGGTWQDWTE